MRIAGVEFRYDSWINTLILALVFMCSTRMIIKQLKQNSLEAQTRTVELNNRIDKVLAEDKKLVDKVILVQAEQEELKHQEDDNILKLQKLDDLLRKKRGAAQ